MNLRRFIVTLYLVLFVGVGGAALVFFVEARAEYVQLKQQEASRQRRLAEAEARLKDQERIIERLRNDPAFVETVIRRKLHYAKPDEFIFRFDD